MANKYIESEREFYDNLEFEDEYFSDYLRTLARRQHRTAQRYTPRRIALAVIVVVMWIVFLLAVAQVTGF